MASRHPAPRHPPTRPRNTAHGLPLVLVDQRPIQRQARAGSHRAQKLQEKAARDLHRHEITDTPAFERRLHGASPAFVTAARELHARMETLSREVDSVQTIAAWEAPLPSRHPHRPGRGERPRP